MGNEVPPGIGLRHRLDGSQWTLDLLYDSAPWESRISTSPPRIVLQSGYRDGKRRELTWERLAPGRYSVTISLEEGTPVRAALQIGGVALPIGPVVVSPGAEWRFEKERLAELRETAVASGGGEITDLAKAWRRATDPRVEPIFLPLPAAAFFLFLLEALITRNGWPLPSIELPTSAARRQRSAPDLAGGAPEIDSAPIAPAPDDTSPPSAGSTPPVPGGGDTRKSRFRHAKKGL